MKSRTFELDAYYAERLDRLAEFYGHKDKSNYGATLLRRAIEESEMWMRSDLFAQYERIIWELEEEQRRLRRKYPAAASPGNGEMDDDIPF